MNNPCTYLMPDGFRCSRERDSIWHSDLAEGHPFDDSDTIELSGQLRDHLHRIELQISELVRTARAQGTNPIEMRYVDGSWPMIPLLLAKSNILLALSQEQ